MGKTPVPLVLVVHSSLLDTPEIGTLREMGHEIQPLCPECAKGHLILGPTCWRIVPELVGYIDLAIKAARRGIPRPYKKKEKAS